ncbi:hypothetical protein BJ912DRAFT_330467 [Pholiota molesta]|nr:hypothetical protein BJ912DRAFT_330467 [Pholiota molesta]
MHSEACPRPVLRSVYFIFPPRSRLTTTHCHSDAWEHISCASLKLPRTSYPATSHIHSTSPPPQVQRRWQVPVHRQRCRPRIPYAVYRNRPDVMQIHPLPFVCIRRGNVGMPWRCCWARLASVRRSDRPRHRPWAPPRAEPKQPAWLRRQRRGLPGRRTTAPNGTREEAIWTSSAHIGERQLVRSPWAAQRAGAKLWTAPSAQLGNAATPRRQKTTWAKPNMYIRPPQEDAARGLNNNDAARERVGDESTDAHLRAAPLARRTDIGTRLGGRRA